MSIVKANRILIDAFGDSVTTWDLQVLFVSLEESGVSLTDFVSEYGGVMRTAKRRLKLLIEAGTGIYIESREGLLEGIIEKLNYLVPSVIMDVICLIISFTSLGL